MKILWITENYYPSRGGMAQSCDRITANLRNAGAYIDILHFTSIKLQRKIKKGVRGNYYAVELAEDQAHSVNIAWITADQLNLKQKYTHIVAFGGLLPMVSAPVFARWLKIKLVVLLRGNDFDLSIFSVRKRDVLFHAIETADLVCSVTSDKIKKIHDFYPDKKVVYIPNSIEKEWNLLPSDIKNAVQWRKQHNIDSEKKIVGLFGVLKAKKGFDFFLDAIRTARVTGNIHLLITGELPGESLQKLLNTHISHTVLPFLDRYELLQYYAVCDAVALPSFYDGMPNVLLESSAVGVPPIISDIAGLIDVVGDDVGNAWVFQNNNLKDAASTLINFVKTSKEEQIKKGENLKMRMKKHFTTQIETNSYMKIFSKV